MTRGESPVTSQATGPVPPGLQKTCPVQLPRVSFTQTCLPPAPCKLTQFDKQDVGGAQCTAKTLAFGKMDPAPDSPHSHWALSAGPAEREGAQ